MKDHCDHLDDVLEAETELIQRHIDEHEWYMGQKLHREVTENEAIVDFVDKYAWIMREFYCGYVCPERTDCEPAQKYLPDQNR